MNGYEEYVRKLRPETVRLLAEDLELDRILYVIAIDEKGKVVVGWPGADTVDAYVQESNAGQNYVQERNVGQNAGQNAEYKVENNLSMVFGLKRFFTEDGRCLVGFHLPSCSDVLFCIK